MYEVTISITEEKADILEKVSRRLDYSLKGVNRVTVLGCRGNRAYLSLACSEDFKELASDCLSYILSDIFITDFKKEYIKRNARFTIGNEVNYSAFIEALVAFDRECDREIVLGSFNLEDYNMLDGIYNFKLGEMRSRWQEVVELASENSFYLMYSDSFFELMKFLVGTLDPKIEEVEVEIRENSFSIESSEDSDLLYEIMQKHYIGQEKLLPILIKLAPKTIKFKGANFLSENVKAVFTELYSEKTEYLS